MTSLVVFAVGFTTAAARSICLTMILSAANWARRLLPTRPKFNSVIGAVWVPGLGLALSSVGDAQKVQADYDNFLLRL